MTTIALQFEATNAGFFENFGNEFVRFTTAPQLLGWELEIALNAHPACKDLIDFHYEPTSGKGHFILPESSLYPVSRHTLRYPLPNVVTQRTVYRWQDQIRDETHTHIATGVHGFESLCCSEMNAEKVEEAIKQKHSILNSWPSITLGEAEMFREDLSLKDVRIAGLSMPDFLTLLFDSDSE